MRFRMLGVLLLAVLASPAAASAHVTVHPNRLPADAFVQTVVRVPNERSDESTTRVDVKFPSGVLFLSYERVPGWRTEVIYRKLAQPKQVFGERITEQVDRVVWSGGSIEPGEFVDFPLSWSTPDAVGSRLTFRALQTYSDGEIVRWIGPPDGDTPAPQVRLTAKDAAVEDVPAGIAAPAAGATPAGEEDAGGERDTLTLALALIAVIAALGALGVALARRPGSR